MRLAFQKIPPTLLRFLRHSYAPEYCREKLLGDVDLVHSTNLSVPRFRSAKKRLVVTIHDLSFVVCPEFHLAGNIVHCLQGVQDAIPHADVIITISQHTRNDLIERMGAAADRVVVTPLAAPPGRRRIEDADILSRMQHTYQLPPAFMLFVGALEPCKNISRLVQAYARLPSALRREVHFVIAGGSGWLNEEVRTLVTALGLNDCVHFIGYVSEQDLPALYSMATIFAYPSLYEGFGLPMLEAMQCGAPVLTANVSALPEVAGDVAVCVSPTNTEEIAAGLRSLLEDSALRTALRARGYQRADSFSWERCAQ